MLNIQSLLTELIACPSVSPKDAGCQAIIIKHLEQLGFACTSLPCDHVHNLWAEWGSEGPLIVFAGHTDVVPIGNPELWKSDPFEATFKDDHCYGRGSCDMKGSLAAMLCAIETFISENPDAPIRLGLLLTSAEEGDDFDDGTPFVMEWLKQQDKHIDYCILGEPSSSQRLGDCIRVGRRGSLTGYVTLFGQQGHVAYPDKADNAIHKVFAALSALTQSHWDNGNEFFPATSLQMTHIQSGVAGNVIPGTVEVQFNFRFSPESSADQLKERVAQLFKTHQLNFNLHWRLNGEPFMTQPGDLTRAAQESIETICGVTPDFNTGGGTSDGRFIAPHGVDLIELGPCNQSMHQINERVSVVDLETLARVYFDLIKRLFT